MNQHSRLSRKKEFIRWFQRCHFLKSPEAKELLHFLLDNPHILRRVHFVENVNNYSNSIVISAEGASTPPFVLRLNNQYFYHVSDFVAQLRTSPPPSIFVWLSFDREYICGFCANVLESKPEKPTASLKQAISTLEKELSKKVIEKEKQKRRILNLIDKALDEGNEKEFIRLAEELKEIS